MLNQTKNLSNPYTLETLIEGLDERGILVLTVLLGQQAMALLSKTKIKEVLKTDKLIIPGAESLQGL